MSMRLPPLQALQAFEAAARHLSYTRAGEELHLTHGAVSRQVHGLEDQLGERLIERLGPRLRLTEAGTELLARLAEPLHELRQALYADAESPGPLQLNTLASLASLWLSPRLATLQAGLPGYCLRVETHYALAQFPPDTPRLGLRYGDGKWPGLKAVALMDEQLLLLSTPRGVARFGADPVTWPASRWVRHEGSHWQDWHAREPEPQGLLAAASVWNDAAAALHAIRDTDGIGLGRLSLAGDWLRAGLLCQVGTRRVAAPLRYWLVHRPEFSRHAGLQALIDGLKALAQDWERGWGLGRA